MLDAVMRQEPGLGIGSPTACRPAPRISRLVQLTSALLRLHGMSRFRRRSDRPAAGARRRRSCTGAYQSTDGNANLYITDLGAGTPADPSAYSLPSIDLSSVLGGWSGTGDLAPITFAPTGATWNSTGTWLFAMSSFTGSTWGTFSPDGSSVTVSWAAVPTYGWGAQTMTLQGVESAPQRGGDARRGTSAAYVTDERGLGARPANAAAARRTSPPAGASPRRGAGRAGPCTDGRPRPHARTGAVGLRGAGSVRASRSDSTEGSDRYGRRVVTVVSPDLLAVDAAWDDGPDAGAWIEHRLGPFGARLGHAVPLGYSAYAVVPIPFDDSEDDPGSVPTINALLDVLGPFTGEQAVHFGMWEGWGWLYDTGADPRMAPGMSAHVAWPEGERPAQEELDRALAEARERMAAERVERPDAAPLDLPHRRYYLWTGPLRSATAFRAPHSPPSLIWPDDRSWFVGAPIYTNEIAVAGTTAVVDAIVADQRLSARRSGPDHILDIDD